MDLTKDFKSFQEQAISALVKTTKTAGQISAEDLNFHRSSNVGVAKALDAQSDRLLRLTNRLTKYATSSSDVKAPQLRDQEDVEDNWRGVVDVIDDLLERTDACLDEFTGVIKRLSPSRQGTPSDATPARSKRELRESSGASLNMAKPQLLFEKKVDNQAMQPWKPLLTSKPHAIEPIEESLAEGKTEFDHPYAEEIRQSRYPQSAYEKDAPWAPGPLNPPATFVDTPEALHSMLAELKKAKEIAIDLEHHDTRSYVGIVCLMQISTRGQDWIVDTLKPWRLKLQALNAVFADPNILKVFHGSHMDMVWLQRDFGLYVVNLFDTYHASVALGLERHSLQFLLEKYCDLRVSKKFQTADWRIRPIPSAMLEYARSDTHYLLYIYDCMRHELVDASTPEASPIDYVHEKSKGYALQKYERQVYDAATGRGPGGWDNALLRTSVHLSKEQTFVFKAVHQWRDRVARSQDDGVHHVMSSGLLFSIAQEMPVDQVALNKACRPITPSVRARVTELLKVIRDAKTAAANAPEPRIPKRSEPTQSTIQPESGRSESDIGGQPLWQGLNRSRKAPKALRLETSQFWGKALPEQSIPSETNLTAEAFSIAFPVPQIAEVSFDGHSGEVMPAPVPNPPPTRTDEVPTPVLDLEPDVFTLKQRGCLRKRKAEEGLEDPNDSDNNPANGEPSMIPFADVAFGEDPYFKQKKEAKRERRAAKKAAKRANKEASSRAVVENGSPATSSPSGFTPFDYENADSVLHAKGKGLERDNGRKEKGKKNREKAFDPFKKALDAEPGLRRLQTEMPNMGKSVTYRS